MARVVGDAKEEEEFDGLRCVLLDEANSHNAMHESRDEDRADTSDEHDGDAMALRFKKIEASESSRLKVSTGEIAILPRGFCFSLLQFKIFLPSMSLLSMLSMNEELKLTKMEEMEDGRRPKDEDGLFPQLQACLQELQMRENAFGCQKMPSPSRVSIATSELYPSCRLPESWALSCTPAAPQLQHSREEWGSAVPQLQHQSLLNISSFTFILAYVVLPFFDLDNKLQVHDLTTEKCGLVKQFKSIQLKM
ncbi:hypothetical protein V8G54_028935 [Vigna mungo]|uniref:Uncharacterized protein n=1 Tax=Vigna mungo TaxID=3915 RepID=A0AAQ3MTU9_VIGMU